MAAPTVAGRRPGQAGAVKPVQAGKEKQSFDWEHGVLRMIPNYKIKILEDAMGKCAERLFQTKWKTCKHIATIAVIRNAVDHV